MYQDKVAVALKSNGKVLREFGEKVYVPFGAEYSFLVKNLNTVRCLVSIQIDGTDIADGDCFVVKPNSSIEIERFLTNSNLSSGQRFKFIERTAKIEEHRGVKLEDGLIRVEFEFEKVIPAAINTLGKTEIHNHYHYDKMFGTDYRNIRFGGATTGEPLNNYFSSTALRSRDLSAAQCSVGSASAAGETFAKNLQSLSADGVAYEEGITVGGSLSSQKFVREEDFPTDGVKHALVFKLVGRQGELPVKEAVTVRAKQKCPTCGHNNKSNAKFCIECGTGLLVPA